MASEIISPEAIKLVKQEESIEITKNSRGYNHSYKLIGKVEEQLYRINNIEKKLKLKFGTGEKNENE